MKQHASREPFFLYVPFNAPHSSSGLEPEVRSTIQAPDEFMQLYPPADNPWREVPRFRYATNSKVATAEARVRNYRAAVSCMDAAIGKMLDLLEERKVLDNTIVIFFSDNGGGGGSDNRPLRGKKGDTWEGGVRVPCLVHWPAGGIEAGVVRNDFLTSLEVLPSLLAATGASAHEGIELDGYDWWPTLRDRKASPRREMFWQRKDTIGVRVGKWKWVQMGKKGSGLFDLSQDINESRDLSKRHPEVLAELKARYQQWVLKMDAAEPRWPFRNY